MAEEIRAVEPSPPPAPTGLADELAAAVARARADVARIVRALTLDADADAVSALRALAARAAAADAPATEVSLLDEAAAAISALALALRAVDKFVAAGLRSADDAQARALLEFAVELAAPADAAACHAPRAPQAAPPPASAALAGAVATLVNELGSAFSGHELFALTALRSDASPASNRAREALSVAGVNLDGRRAAESGEFVDKKGFFKDVESERNTLWNRSDHKEKVIAMLSPPRPSRADAELGALLDVDDVRIGVWNILGNSAFAQSAVDAAGENGSTRRESAVSKAGNLARLVAAERWTACALQEVSQVNTLAKHAGAHAALKLWSFVTSGKIGDGVNTGYGEKAKGEAAVFGFDTCAWTVAHGPVVYPESYSPSGAAPYDFARRPALLLLRSRVAPDALLALVSVHLDPKLDDACREAAALASHAAPWVDAELTSFAHVDIARVTVAICGDFNLAPPGHGKAEATAAWAGLVHAGFASTKEDETPSNVPDFGDTPAAEYDNVFVRGAPGRAAARVIDTARDARFSRLANEVDAAAAAVDGLIKARASAPQVIRDFVTNFVTFSDKAAEAVSTMRKAARMEFLRTWSAFAQQRARVVRDCATDPTPPLTLSEKATTSRSR